MPFEQAKHQFETITQGTPEKVEGNWQQFRHEIGNYLMNKQQEVTEYIENSRYPGKENDISNYHGELRDSIGGIINDNEVTRTEMTEYKNLLTTRSEALKQKIETVAVEKEFKAIESIYKFAGLNLNIQDNIRVYLSVPKNQRIPVQQIKEYLDKFSPFPMVGRDRIYRPKEATDFIKENSNVLYTMLNHLCYGSKERAEALAKPIIEQLQFIDMCAETANARENQDVFKNVIGTSEMIFILSSLIDTGISKDKVAGFFLTNFKKLRDIAGDDFEKTFSAYRLKPDLNNPQVWLAGILAVSEARNPQALDAIKLTMKIEGEILSKKADILNIIHHKNLLRNDLIRKVYAYNEIEPEVSIDKNISRFERESAQTGLEIAVGEKELVLLEAKHALANMYLGESGVNPSSSQTQGKIREILNAGSSNDINRLSLELNLRRSPRQLAILQAKELEEGVARQEYEYKQFIENNGRINENENVIGTLDRFYRTGSLSGSSKEFLREGYGIQSEHLKKLIDEHEEKASDNQPYFDEQISLNYKTIRDVPRANVAEVIQRLSGQMALLKNLHASHIRYIGFLESQLVLGESAARINKQVNDSKSKLTGLAEKINQIRRFLGVEEEDKELADVENQILSPIAMPIMRREFASYFNKIDGYQKNVAEAARPIDYIGKNIERWQEENPRLVPDQFDRGIASIDKLVATLESARGNLENDIKSLEGELADTEKENALPESFRATRKQFIRKLIDDIKILLNSPDSGFSRMNIMNVSLMAMQLRNDRYKYLRHGMFKGIATAFILAAAVGVACLGAFAVQGVVANIAVSGTLSAKLGAGTLTTGMISAGGVVGSRLAQLGLQAADMADFGGGLKIINPKDMAKDFAFGFAICGGAILSAKALVGTLRWAAQSEGYVSFRWPGMTRFAQNSLNRLDRISDFANPITWWRGRTVPGTESALTPKQAFFRRFGRETREEIYQESLEEGAGRIHSTGEFLIAMASSARAGGRRLRVHGLRAAQVGISVEGDSMVYTTRTPQEFLANFRQQNPGTEGTDYRMKVDNDNSVTIELMSGRVDPRTGIHQIYSVIDVKPAMNISNISTDVEFARVRGLTTVEGRPDVFRVQNTEQGIDVLAEFYNRGFNIIKTETGTIRVSKGERSIEIEGTAEMMQQLNIKTAAELTEQLQKGNEVFMDNISDLSQDISQIGNLEGRSLANFVKNFNKKNPNKFPDKFRIIKKTQDGKIVAVNEKGRLEIFKSNDYMKISSQYRLNSYIKAKFDSPNFKNLPVDKQAKIIEEYKKSIEFMSSESVQKKLYEVVESLDGVSYKEKQALLKHIEENALEQHKDNPEQYVSHGFDHSLNVLKYAEEVMQSSPEITNAIKEKYNVSQKEAVLLGKLIAIYHDFGYPAVEAKNLGKALHGLTGAQIVSSKEFYSILQGVIKSPKADVNKIMNDLKNSILYHSADKVESTFEAKVHIAHATFLVNSDNITEAIRIALDKHDPGDPIEVVCSKQLQTKIEGILKNTDYMTKYKIIFRQTKTESNLDEKGLFHGRYMDLKANKDKLIGLQYKIADMKQEPLNFLIRLADNLDMQTTRFSELQGTRAFGEVYHAFGPTTKTGDLLVKLENHKEMLKKNPDLTLTPDITNQLKTLGIDMKQEFGKIIEDYKNKIIDEILVKHPDDAARFPKLREIGMAQNSESVRHFGGCEAVKGVKFEGGRGTLSITVDRVKFEKLNETKVVDSTIDANGNKENVIVGIGEYQIWRGYDAYKSLISSDGKPIKIEIKDENGRTLPGIGNFGEYFTKKQSEQKTTAQKKAA